MLLARAQANPIGRQLCSSMMHCSRSADLLSLPSIVLSPSRSCYGAQRALEELDRVADDPRLVEYQPYWAARADLLARINAREEACQAYSIAIGLERDPSVRRFLEQRRTLVDG